VSSFFYSGGLVIAHQLKKALEECALLREENKRLRSPLGIRDYVDVNLAMLTLMREKRLKGYRTTGYSIRDAEEEVRP
jgi:hypothetical protein